MAVAVSVPSIQHPYYSAKFVDWLKWRLVYEGGQSFINHYLEQFSNRESNLAFAKRRKLTYNPAFAKEAIDEIKNSIFQRLVDISRKGGSDSYNRAIRGLDGGIDLMGSSMAGFLGEEILPELLPMARVGVYVDMPEVSGVTVADAMNKRPYVYLYKAEDIRSWAYDDDANGNEFSNILLRDYYLEYDNQTGLPSGEVCRFRRMWIEDNQVHIQYYAENGTKTSQDGEAAPVEDTEIVLDIPRIPFVLLELSDSLLSEVANYQIALLNLASSDISYILTSNFPFYTEQYDPRSDSSYLRRPGTETGGQQVDAQQGRAEEVRVGTTTGRRYPQGLDRPGFINPSSEPLKISMEKQEQMKAEIRQLVNLAVTNLQPAAMASAESKQADQQGLESGLSYIGLTLQNAERKIAEFWDMYEKQGMATVNYPETYEIKSESAKQNMAVTLAELVTTVPSKTYQKAICKRIAELTIGRTVTADELEKIMKEIESAKGASCAPDVILQNVEAGILDLETAAELCGYPPDTVKKAAKDHAERLARIAESQSSQDPQQQPGQNADPAARGIKDLATNPGANGKQEKKNSLDTTKDGKVSNKQRGAGRFQ
jgi:hypothetical protein